MNVTEIVEPEVWIEYMRVDLKKDNFGRRSFADAIHRSGLMPDGCIVRGRTDGNDSVWEYLM